MDRGGNSDRSAVERAFVGRERERAELCAALDDADNGRGSLFLISGEPGIGKTRLADELAAEAGSRGMRVAWGRCWEGGGAPAYWPWVEIVRSVVFEPDRARLSQTAIPPEIGQLIPELLSETIPKQISSDPQQARFRLFDAVATLLKQVARSFPQVLILDDLHEADRSSLELLKFVAHGLTDSRILIVGTYRDAEVRRAPDLAQSISEIARHGNPMPLFGLEENEVTQMIENRAERTPSATFASELHRVTAGNPLFVDGIIRVLVAERKLGTAEHLDLSGFKLPEGVRGAIRKHLALLSPQAQSALAAAAVIGAEFDSVLLERVSKLSAGALAELIREASDVGIVAAASRETHRFTHALIREALYNDTADTERVVLHRATGEALEQMHAANLTPHLSALAHHFGEAGVVEKAIDYGIRAGNAAQAVFAFEEAFSLLRSVRELINKHGGPTSVRARVFRMLGEEMVSGPRCLEYLEEAADTLERLGDGETAAWAHGQLGLSLSSPTNSKAQNIARGLHHLRQAEQVLCKGPARLDQALFYLQLTPALTWALEIDEGLKAAHRAREIAEKLDGAERDYCRSHSACMLAKLLILRGRLAEGFALAQVGWETANKINNPLAASSAAWSGGHNHVRLWDPTEGERWFLRELDNARTAKSPAKRTILITQLVESSALRGALDEARYHVSQISEEISRVSRGPALITLFSGTWDQAAMDLANLMESCDRAGYLENLTYAMYWRSRLYRFCGHYADARGLLERTIAISAERGNIWGEMMSRPEAILLYADMDAASAGIPHIQRIRHIMAAGEDWLGFAGQVTRAEAVIEAAHGRGDEANAQFKSAVTTFKRYTLPWEEAETLLYWGRALNAAGEHGRANENFDAAIELYRRHGGGQRWIDRVEADRQAGPRRSVPIGNNGTADTIFRREGEFWTIAWHGKAIRLKDAKGLHYIAYLLAHPGHQIHVHDLVTVVEGSAVDTGSHAAAHSDGLEIVRDVSCRDSALDPRARSEYGARLRELRTELDEADRFNDSGRAERLCAEIDLVSNELTAGLGRRAGSDNAERARSMVSKRIRATLDKIHDEDPALGRHFATSIKTGYFCAYLPDPDHKIAWQM